MRTNKEVTRVSYVPPTAALFIHLLMGKLNDKVNPPSRTMEDDNPGVTTTRVVVVVAAGLCVSTASTSINLHLLFS